MLVRNMTLILSMLAFLGQGCTGMKSDGLATGFIRKTMDLDGETRGYVVYVPDGYTPGREWPLIVFLHGAGERGDEGWSQTAVGIGKPMRWHPERFPCVVLMPQCPKNSGWARRPAREGRAARQGSGEHIDLALKKTLAQYNIDRDRITLTGLSMGGYGTWSYGAQHTDTFAALMPICGGGRVEDADRLSKIPIWAFHGDADRVVPVERSRVMVEAVKQAGGEIKYTEYPGVGHNSWEQSYDDPESIAWLLEQKRD